MVFNVTYYLRLYNTINIYKEGKILPSKSQLCYTMSIQYLIFVDTQQNLLREVIALCKPKYKVTLNTLNGVVVSFGCNSTWCFKSQQLPVVIPVQPQFIHKSLDQYRSFPSFKLSTCPATNIHVDFWACIIIQDPSGVSKADKSLVVTFRISFLNLR